MTQTHQTADYKRKNEQVVQLLIYKVCNVKHVDDIMRTPMTVACRRGNKKIV